MKKTNGILAAFAISLALSGHSLAADMSNFSIGVKGGSTIFDDDELEVDDSELKTSGNAAFGLNLGYEFAPGWTAELQFVSSSVEFAGVNTGRSIDLDIRTAAGYAAYRSSGPLYFIGRIGLVSMTRSIDDVRDNIALEDSESGLSFGFGGGYRLSPNLGLELDYTIVAADTDWLLVSARYSFD